MDALASIFEWLSDHEAAISAVAAIIVIGGVIFAGVRWLLLRGGGERLRKILAGSTARTRLIAAGAAALLILAGAGVWLMLPDEPTTEVASEVDPLLALPTGPVVAVLPFENLSEDPKQEFFSDGLTDGIITALSRFKDLFVIARNSTFRYKGQAVDVRKLREELGARYVVEGSVQKAGTSLRVTAQLLDASDGTHLWADTYDRDLSTSNIFAIQDEITEQVVGTIAGLSGVISRARFAKVKDRPTDALDAYEWVLQAAAYYRDNATVTKHQKIRDGLERAVNSDPNYADAWAYLTFIYLDEHRFNYNPKANPLDRALEAALRAVASDPASQQARFALGEAHFFRKEIEAFFAEADRVIALNPNDSSFLAALGWNLVGVRDERGMVLLRRAIKLDPFHPTWFYWPMAFYHFHKDEFEEALAEGRKIVWADSYMPQVLLAAIYAELGRHGEARSASEEVLRLDPGFTTEKWVEERRKWNESDEMLRRWATALRKAGLPE